MDKDIIFERIQQLTHPLEPISVTHVTKLQSIKGIRCVAFDFYGTMFISAVGDIGVDEEQQETGFKYFYKALKDTGFTVKDDSAGENGIAIFEETITNHIREAREKGRDHPEPDIVAVWVDVLNKLADRNEIEGQINREKAKRFGIEFEFRINDVWPVPNLESLLNQLLEKGLELGIISNSQYYTPLTFEALLNKSPAAFGFNPNLLIWSYKTGLKKPSVDFYRIFEEAAEKEGLQPEEVLYVGNDVEKDIIPAQKVGLRTALYVGDQRSIRHIPQEFDIEKIKPDLVVDELSQIADYLE